MIIHSCLLAAPDGYDWSSIILKVLIIAGTASLGLSDEIRKRFFAPPPDAPRDRFKGHKDRAYVGIMMLVLTFTLLSTYFDTKKSAEDSRNAAQAAALSEKRQHEMDSLLLISSRSLAGIIQTSDSINRQNQAVLSNTQKQLMQSDSITGRIQALGNSVVRNFDRLREPIQDITFDIVFSIDLTKSKETAWYPKLLDIYREGKKEAANRKHQGHSHVIFTSTPAFDTGIVDNFTIDLTDSLLMISRREALNKGFPFDQLQSIGGRITIVRGDNNVLEYSVLTTSKTDSVNVSKKEHLPQDAGFDLSGEPYSLTNLTPGDQVVIDLRTKKIYLVLKDIPGTLASTTHELSSPLDFYDQKALRGLQMEVVITSNFDTSAQYHWPSAPYLNNIARMKIKMNNGRYEIAAQRLSEDKFPLRNFSE